MLLNLYILNIFLSSKKQKMETEQLKTLNLTSNSSISSAPKTGKSKRNKYLLIFLIIILVLLLIGFITWYFVTKNKKKNNENNNTGK